MAATEMNFGPDWLRALQDGLPKNEKERSAFGNPGISTSTSRNLNKLAPVKFRYSCEEMLLYYNRDYCFPPKDLVENEEVYIERVQEPLLFSEPTIEEINLLSQSINSDYIVKKAAKENGDGASDRPAEYRDRNEERENRAKLLTASGDMIIRKPPGISGIGNSGLGMFSERGSGHPLRPGRGGNVAERGSRTGLRNTGSLFARVSSYDETTTRSNTITSATLLTSKKGGLQRSSTESSSTSSATSIPNMFVPAWRTSTTSTTNQPSTAAPTNNTGTAESKSEWRSNSDASKNWRSDGSASSATNTKAAPNTPHKTPTKEAFEGDDAASWDRDAREYLNRKRGANPAAKSTTKPFNRRFDSENNDLFKSKTGFEALDSFETDDRDLFGGGRLQSSSFSGYELLGSSGRGKPQNASGVNRFARGDYGQNNEKWNHGSKSYGQNDRENRYSYRYQNQHYQRSNSHANEDDGERFGGGAPSDDDDYRRNSLPEWSLEDPCSIDVTRVGTFDASGAFHEAIEEDGESTGNDKNRDGRRKDKQNLPKTKPNEQSKAKQFATSEDDPDSEALLKKDLPSNRFSSEESNRSSQQVSHSALRVEHSKVDYFNMSDPNLSPNSKPKTIEAIRKIGNLTKDEDNFAQMEKDARKLLSKFELDEEGEASLLSNQLNKLLKEESQSGESQSLDLHALHSHGDNLNFLRDRFQQSQQSGSTQQQSSLFSSSLMNQLIGRENATSGPGSNENHSGELMNQRLLSNSSLSSHTNPSHSILNDNYAFNFATPSSVSSSVSNQSNSNAQSLFSGLSSMRTSSTKPLSTFESSLGLGLEQNDDINNRLNLGAMQKQKREQEISHSDTAKASPSLKPEGDSSQWFYRDPQGTVQGPFTSTEMYDWFVSGYFTMDLLVRRACDSNFSKLGDLYHSMGRTVPFVPSVHSAFMQADSNLSGNSFMFGSDLLASSNLNHSQAASMAPSIVPPSPSFLQDQPSPQLQPSLPPQPAKSQNHLPFGAMLDDMNNKPTGNILNMGGSAYFSNSQPSTASIKDDSPVQSSTTAGNSSLLNILQRQQSQPNLPTSQLQQDSQIANLLGIGPKNTAQAQNQLRLILSHLMKNERFQHLTNAQQHQIVMEKFIQLNNQNLMNSNNNQFQQQVPQAQTHSDLFANQQTLPQSRPTEPTSIEGLQKPTHEEINQTNLAEKQQPQPKVATQEPFEPHPSTHLLQHKQAHQATLEQAHQTAQSGQPQVAQQSKPNPLQMLQAAIAAGSNSSTQWENIVPGAMSLSAVEELQRREAEERYKQQQDLKKNEEDSQEFEHKVDRKRQTKTKSLEMPAKLQQTVKQELIKQLPSPTHQSTKVQVIDSKPVIVEDDKFEQVPILQTSSAAQKAPLPKKSVWGNVTSSSDADASSAMSIAEIQKLQEEKEREDEESRKRMLEQQMASFIANQQQSQSARPGIPPLKWASQSWQEQNNSKIKTLAEIQAEEAEKATALRAQQESDAKRRVVATANVASLSAIVSKGSGGAWNSSNSQLFTASGPNQKNSMWDEDENPTLAAASAMTNSGPANYKGVANKANNKIDSAFIKQILKTNPKNIKKIEESQLSKIAVDSIDELCRYSVDILNKTFDSIDAPGFISIIKELSTPAEVIEYMQSYLGNNQSAMYFAKFYISKKSFLYNRSKQENVERAKIQIEQAKSSNNQRQVGIWEEDDDDTNYRSGVTYKSALGQNIQGQGNQKKSNSTGQPKTKGQQNQTKNNKAAAVSGLSENDANIMNAAVESMEEFDNWCLEVLQLNSDLDIDAETFISFLKDLDSPFEINEYVQTYLGTSKLARDFAKNFISKRSYLRNKNKNEQFEDMCGPAPALNPSVNKSEGVNDNNGFVTVGNSNKKKRKGKTNTTQQPQPQTTTIHTTTLD